MPAKKPWLVNDPEARALRARQLSKLVRATQRCMATLTLHLIMADEYMQDGMHKDVSQHLVDANILVGGMRRNIDGAFGVINEQLAANVHGHKPKRKGRSK